MVSEGGFAGDTAMQDVNKDLKEGVTIDTFDFPSIDPKYGNPVMGGADFGCLFADSPEARTFIRYLSTKEAGEILAGAGRYPQQAGQHDRLLKFHGAEADAAGP